MALLDELADRVSNRILSGISPPDVSGFDIGDAARAGAYFLLRPPEWSRRHVEQLTIEGERVAFRRLTIDIELPDDPAAAFDAADGKYRYCLPLSRMSKAPPTSRVDIKTEDGTSLPLLTRLENADISRLAYLQALYDATGTLPSASITQAVEYAIYRDGGFAEAWAALIAILAREEGLAFPDPTQLACLEQAAFELAGNSFLWTILKGEPRERRIIKFGYRIPLKRSRVIRKQQIRVKTAIVDDAPLDYKEIVSTRIKWRRTTAQVVKDGLAALGYIATRVSLEHPRVREAASYHFQVQAPPGAEVRRVRLEATVRDRRGREIKPTPEYEGASAHLYLAGAASIEAKAEAPIAPAARELDLPDPEPPLRINVHLRVARKGFFNLAVVSSTLIAGALWGFQAGIEHAAAPENSQIAAGVLLVMPALLVVFAVRPEEHAWASRLLVGVRGLMLAAATLAAAGAAALAGVRPTASASAAFIIYATGATVIAATSWLAWLASWEPWRWWRRRAPRAGEYLAGTLAALLPLAYVAGANLGGGAWPAPSDPLAAGICTASLVGASAWLVLGVRPKPGAASPLARAWPAATMGLAIISAAAGYATDSAVLWIVLAALVLVCTAAAVIVFRNERRRERAEGTS